MGPNPVPPPPPPSGKGGIPPQLAAVLKGITDAVVATFKGLSQLVMVPLKGLTDVVVGGFKGLATVVATPLAAVGGAVGSTLKSIGAAITEAWSKTGVTLKSVVPAAAEMVRQAFAKLASDLRNPVAAIKGAGSAVAGGVVAVGTGLAKLGGAAVGAAGRVSKAFEQLNALAQQVNSFVVKASPGSSQLFERAIADFQASIGQILVPLLNAATTVARQFGSAIYGASGAFSRFTAVFESPAFTAAVSALARVFAQLLGVVGEVLGQFAPLIETILTIGTTLVDALAPVVELATALVASGVAAVASVAVPTVKAAAEAIAWLVNNLKQLVEYIGRFLKDVLGLSLTVGESAKPKDNTGVAVRSATISGPQEALREAIKSAAQAGLGGKKPDAQTAENTSKLLAKWDTPGWLKSLEEIWRPIQNVLDQIWGWLGRFLGELRGLFSNLAGSFVNKVNEFTKVAKVVGDGDAKAGFGRLAIDPLGAGIDLARKLGGGGGDGSVIKGGLAGMQGGGNSVMDLFDQMRKFQEDVDFNSFQMQGGLMDRSIKGGTGGLGGLLKEFLPTFGKGSQLTPEYFGEKGGGKMDLSDATLIRLVQILKSKDMSGAERLRSVFG